MQAILENLVLHAYDDDHVERTFFKKIMRLLMTIPTND